MFPSLGLKRVINFFRGHRGAVAPINTLPVETLSEIFFFTIDKDPSIARCGKALKVCTWVCCHWRQVALHDPRLWSLAINPEDSEDWMKEMLLRSKNTPFRIEFNHEPLGLGLHPGPLGLELASLRCEGIIRNVLLAMQFIHRVRHFRITASSRLCLQFLSKLTLSLPMLSSIYVINEDVEPLFADDPPLAPHLPAGLFMLDAPKLDVVSFADWNFDWDLFKFTSLTQLHVVFSKAQFAARPTFQQLSLVLTELPLLTAVSLMNVLPADIPFVTRPCILLELLEILALEGGSQECIGFLNILVHPAYTMIHLVCRDTPLPLTPIVGIIRDKFSDHQLHTLSLHLGPYSFCLCASSNESDEVSPVLQAIELEFLWDNTPNLLDLLPLPLALPSGDVDVLCITGHPELTISTSTWNVLLSHFREINSLHLEAVPLQGLLPLLVPAMDGFLPRLKRISARLARSDEQAVINYFIEQRRDDDHEGEGVMMNDDEDLEDEDLMEKVMKEE
ncbi:hypothetical protein BJ138DRAFT_1118117 [Hygrophoropsis aurantiaca]|uniref:Uncharacterized protein n=1 Tax=Hygrophoropsis aurantiaca TaxID=72124 RepID=A0ACB7ZX77_9AGAM|nr:hypothetical protein BJ138DRAFT_1118117 [Hygrophoropsis aurantiaca]